MPTIRELRHSRRLIFAADGEGRLYALWYRPTIGEFWLTMFTTNKDETDEYTPFDEDGARAVFAQLQEMNRKVTGQHQAGEFPDLTK